MRNLEFKLQNLKNAYARLCEACAIYDGTNAIVRDSVIQRFEFTYELCHKVLREFIKYMGLSEDNSFPRTIFKTAYANNIIDDDKLWIRLLEDRNKTSHVYSEGLSDDIAYRVKNEYLYAVGDLIERIEQTL